MLVLTKTKELFVHQTTERKAWASDLTWLKNYRAGLRFAAAAIERRTRVEQATRSRLGGVR